MCAQQGNEEAEPLTRDQILAALETLSDKLAERGITGEKYLIEGLFRGRQNMRPKTLAKGSPNLPAVANRLTHASHSWTILRCASRVSAMSISGDCWRRSLAIRARAGRLSCSNREHLAAAYHFLSRRVVDEVRKLHRPWFASVSVLTRRSLLESPPTFRACEFVC